jgi:hypothetical protein
MKNTTIITNLVTLNLVLFLSMGASAKSRNSYSRDNETKTTKNKISALKSTNSGMASPEGSENEFSYLRFDVNKYGNGNENTAAASFTGSYLRFDVSKYMDLHEAEATEMPSTNDFDYLRFNVNDYMVCNSANELPVNEFEYLRFDSNNFSPVNSIDTDIIPAS